MIKRFWNDTSGATSVEYGIIATVLSLAIITGVGALAVDLNSLWGRNATTITTGMN